MRFGDGEVQAGSGVGCLDGLLDVKVGFCHGLGLVQESHLEYQLDLTHCCCTVLAS